MEINIKSFGVIPYDEFVTDGETIVGNNRIWYSSTDVPVLVNKFVKLKDAAKFALEVMNIQEKREQEMFHLSAEAFRPMWDKAKNDLFEAIEGKQPLGCKYHGGVNADDCPQYPCGIADCEFHKKLNNE